MWPWFFMLVGVWLVMAGGTWWLIAGMIPRYERDDLARREREMRADLAREALLASRASVDASERARARVSGLHAMRDRNGGMEHRPRSYAKGWVKR